MLELIHDNRSGTRLEIVIPTFNEEYRIDLILRRYAPRFDVVLLDDRSTDDTVTCAIRHGGTVFRRAPGTSVPESFFALYANTLSKSRLIFWLIADEFAAVEDLQLVEEALRDGYTSVMCRRINWYYGRRVITYTHKMPRGFIPGAVQHDPTNLHQSLLLTSLGQSGIYPREIEVQHLHVVKFETVYGVVGTYAWHEVEGFKKGKRPHWRFFRTYVVSVFTFFLFKWWRERSVTPAALFMIGCTRVITCILAMMAWVAQRHLPLPEQQRELYARFFTDQDALVVNQIDTGAHPK